MIKKVSLKRRLRGVITRECVAKGIYIKNINFACEQAELLLDKGNTVAACSNLGVAVAESRQRSSNRRRRNAMSNIG